MSIKSLASERRARIAYGGHGQTVIWAKDASDIELLYESIHCARCGAAPVSLEKAMDIALISYNFDDFRIRCAEGVQCCY